MKKVELIVTEKGGSAPNRWKKGQKVKVHPEIAKQLIEKGLASDKPEVKVKEEKPKEKETK